MIALELSRVVVDEPVEAYSRRGSAHVLTDCRAGDANWAHLHYLPQLALVVMVHRAGHVCIVPIEHVWHMTAPHSAGDSLELLASVIP